MTPNLSVLVLDFNKPVETCQCLESIRNNLLVPHKTVLLDNGSQEDYPWQLYKEGLADVLISKKIGMGGGFGQTDLFRWCDTQYAIFVQNDQELVYKIGQSEFDKLTSLFAQGFHCIDLNGDQSHRGVWTDRAHLIETSFFNSLGPFPNGGPGNDAIPWNEQYIQNVFQEKNYQIAHVTPTLFIDLGKWSIRKAGDGLYKHRCDLKTLYVLEKPTYRTKVYPPLDLNEWDSMLKGEWVDGTIPNAWKEHSFRAWPD